MLAECLSSKAPRAAPTRAVHTDYESMLVDPQCAARPYYSMVFLERIGPRLGQFDRLTGANRGFPG